MTRASPLSRLLSGLRRETHDYRPSLQLFPDLNVEKIAADMDLAALGAGRGARNEPPTTSPALDEVELRVVERIEAEKKAAHATHVEQLQTYGERLAGLDFEGRFGEIRQSAPAAVSEYRAEASQGRDELFVLRRQLRDLEDERDAFKRKSNLNRTARHSGGGFLWLKVGALMCLFVVEVLLNGVFLAKGNDQGILGGASEAFVFALLNIGVSFLVAAIGVRQINHVSSFRKLVGYASLLFYLAFAVLINLALAHYRDASGAMLEDAGREVVQRISTSPLAFSDIKSWLFLGTGLMFSAAAFGDAFLIYDPYPGFGDLEKRVAAAHSAYAERRAELTDRLREIRDEYADGLEEANRDLAVRRGEYDAILENRGRLAGLFEAHQDHLERAAGALLATYRDANTQARTTRPPKRFATGYALQRLPTGLGMDDPRARDDLRRSIADAQTVLVQQVSAIHEEFERAAATYREIDQLLPEDTHVAPTLAAA